MRFMKNLIIEKRIININNYIYIQGDPDTSEYFVAYGIFEKNLNIN